MKSIGIKLADGSFFPILTEGSAQVKTLDLTTVRDGQTKVHVDLYRSDTNSMENAEYVDTLEITNLNPHENGEPVFHLDLSLDSNGQLSAKIQDTETGKESNTSVTLVSRTLAERTMDEGSDFSLDIEPEEDMIGPSTNDETFAFDEINKETNSMEETAEIQEDIPVEETSYDGEDLDLPEEEISVPVTQNQDDSMSEPLDIFATDPSLTTESQTDSVFGTDDIFASAIADDLSTTDDIFSDTTDVPLDESAISIEDPTYSEAAEASAPKETGFDMAEEEISTSESEEISADDSMDVSFDESEDASIDASIADSADDSIEEPAPEETNFDIAEEEVPPDLDNLSMDSVPEENTELDLPDFDPEATLAEDPIVASGGEDLFADIAGSDSLFDTTGMDDIPEDPILNSADPFAPENNDLDDVFSSDFGDPDLSDTNSLESDSVLDDSYKTKDPTFVPQNNMFSDLYDEETIKGSSSAPYDYEEDDTKKKTKVPVIICIVCAVICVIATLLVLFVIPSKINVVKKGHDKQKQPAPVEEIIPQEDTLASDQILTQEQQDTFIPEEDQLVDIEVDEPLADLNTEEPEPLEAKEDEIVVADKPQAVVPELPVPPAEKIPDIRYKVKWGDTLWDISASYYKNPWKYKFLARYNNIKNPDHIVSGTIILIPAE